MYLIAHTCHSPQWCEMPPDDAIVLQRGRNDQSYLAGLFPMRCLELLSKRLKKLQVFNNTILRNDLGDIWK